MRQRAFTIFSIACWCWLAAAGQKLPFQNISTDKGLIQSQVRCITQDRQRHLWLGTLGGIDRFDGSSFTHFTKAEGLHSAVVLSLYTASNGHIWAGTVKGISCYNGYNIRNYPFPGNPTHIQFTAIAQDAAEGIWALDLNNGLFRLQNGALGKVPLPFDSAKATCLYRDANGDLLAYFQNGGTFKWAGNRWQPFAAVPALGNESILTIWQAGEAWYACSGEKVFQFIAGTLAATTSFPQKDMINCAASGPKGDIWVGTQKGLYVFDAKKLAPVAHYAAAAGLSDNAVMSLRKDAEGNFWIGTDGEGLFRFSDGAFGRYDKGNGLPGNVVMGIAKDRGGNLFIGTREGGMALYSHAAQSIQPTALGPLGKKGVNCMAMDSEYRLFWCTVEGKVWRLANGRALPILLEPHKDPSVNAIVPNNGKVWFATNYGCYLMQGDMVHKIKGTSGITFSVLPIDGNETLIGTLDGLFTYDGQGTATKVAVAPLENASVTCMVKFGDLVVLGTFDEGVYCWNRQSGKVYQCNSKNGLSDNQVFNVFVDGRQRLWASTGTGLQQLRLLENRGTFALTRYSAADGYENCESNLNAMAEDNNGRIWIGTTKGAFVFNGDQPPNRLEADKGPHVVIQRVDIAPGLDSRGQRLPWYPLPDSLHLPFSKNNISFLVKGIYLKHPEAVRYSCQLVGYNQAFSQMGEQAFFNYQNLAPGNYVFRVKAYTTSGLQSDNIAEYSFTVATPFYKTNWFLFVAVLALLATGGVGQFLFMRQQQRKQRQRALIRQEEQQAIRLRTSEDFHDELGNKLTRISLLADILHKKTGANEHEQNRLIGQIKENVLALYAGTRDIIWSLSAGSDNLLENIRRIEQFGEELFHGSGIAFSLSGAERVDAGLVLPMDYCRNILMIFKESLNNSLKHAGCSRVAVTVEVPGDGRIVIVQTDNGKGFEAGKAGGGNGLNNMRRRAQRINAELTVHTGPGEGVRLALSLKIPQKG
jgi:ligand-binding sensor domain-containing protein/signal transduction histidine kinase